MAKHLASSSSSKGSEFPNDSSKITISEFADLKHFKLNHSSVELKGILAIFEQYSWWFGEVVFVDKV